MECFRNALGMPHGARALRAVAIALGLARRRLGARQNYDKKVDGWPGPRGGNAPHADRGPATTDFPAT